METIVKLQIERIEENGKVYYLATSEDVQGLVAQGDTLEETLEIAADVARIMFEIDEEWNKPSNLKPLPDNFEYSLVIKV